jgi:hypothetical protein
LDENLLVKIEVDTSIDKSKWECRDHPDTFELKHSTTKRRKHTVTDLRLAGGDAGKPPVGSTGCGGLGGEKSLPN